MKAMLNLIKNKELKILNIKRDFEKKIITYECEVYNKRFNLINYYLEEKFFIENKIFLKGTEVGNDMIKIKDLDFLDWFYMKRLEILKGSLF